jgi:hypothetical protein
LPLSVSYGVTKGFFCVNIFFDKLFLLVQSQLRRLKDDITQLSKRNFKLEKDLKFFDSKIALLITHKISFEVRINHSTLKMHNSLIIVIVDKLYFIH